MTVEQPINTAQVWFVNAVDYFPIDVFINGSDQPTLTDVSSLEIGSVFEADGTAGRPFQTYAFKIRRKDDPSRGQPDIGVLAEASVDLRRGLSFTAVFHAGDAPYTYQLSVFANDFRASGNGRLEVRHTAFPKNMTWTIEPKPGADPQIPFDQRSGALERGQWQQATELVENDYRLEVRVDGQLYAFNKDLEIEAEKMLATYFVGNPEPATTELNDLENYLLVQEFKLPPGPTLQKVVTAPAPAFTQTNTNQPVSFDLPELIGFESNIISGEITATDPDGYVTNLAIVGIRPDFGSIRIPDNGVTPSETIGDPATAIVCVGGDTPAGCYDIHVRSNPQSLADTADVTLKLEVKPVTAQRLSLLVENFRVQARIEAGFAQELQSLTDEIATAVANDALALAQERLTTFAGRVESEAGAAVEEQASKNLSREAKAMSAWLERRQKAAENTAICAT
ncbi:hypothetical protein CKO28_06875 [Rhodovibrio sodomensis]|uniref:Uncharacterized protein n=1 Tax=Rhodovibrio sodomensis TaxID=1088 RepID=A0ABS1DBK3_9PROT|nr:hypothetical protein [Rhodovibrio sodomensis]MBK1667755.1 hypothetical protein [Rhodovibrio sodomensis]